MVNSIRAQVHFRAQATTFVEITCFYVLGHHHRLKKAMRMLHKIFCLQNAEKQTLFPPQSPYELRFLSLQSIYMYLNIHPKIFY